MDQNEQEKLAKEIEERRSQTHWSKRNLSAHAWELLIEAARRAPSSWNHQPARYILLKDGPSIKKAVSAFHRINDWASKASGLIVQIADPRKDDRIEGKDYYLYDCGLAMMSLVYQAQFMGLSSRQMIGWDETEIKQILHIPEPFRVVVITALGYPDTSAFRQCFQDAKRAVTQQNRRFKADHIAYWHSWKGVAFHEE